MARPVAARQFHSTPRAFVKVGDALPDVDLHEDSPANKVNLVKEYGTGIANGVVIGVPAAFSGSCSQVSIPKPFCPTPLWRVPGTRGAELEGRD
jgi:2-Cys peroxiredoxin 5